jgi:hypothetical protein
MNKKILSLITSIGVIILGIYLSQNSNRLFYGLILCGVLYGLYDIYLIATHNRTTQEQQEANRKLAEQSTFDNTQTEIESNISEPDKANNKKGFATITVHWFKEKMGLGALPVYVNGVSAGVIKKDNLHVTYHTNVPFNIIFMGTYRAKIDLSPGDTVEYFVAGNGIRHERTILTKGKNSHTVFEARNA